MSNNHLYLGSNLVNIKKALSASWFVMSPEENSGVPLVNWIRIIFENAHVPLEITGDYEKISEYVRILRQVLKGDDQWKKQ